MVCRGHWTEIEWLLMLLMLLMLVLRRLGVEELRIQRGGIQKGLICLRIGKQRFVKTAVEASRVV